MPGTLPRATRRSCYRTWPPGGWGAGIADTRSLRPFLHFDDLVGDQAVGLTVHRGGGFLARSLDETEDLARALVVPVAQIADAVLVLDLEILLMRVPQRLSLQSVDLVVHVEIEWHRSPFATRRPISKCRSIFEKRSSDRAQLRILGFTSVSVRSSTSSISETVPTEKSSTKCSTPAVT